MPCESTWTTFLQKGGNELSARDARPFVVVADALNCASCSKQAYVCLGSAGVKHYMEACPSSLASVRILCGVSGLPCVACETALRGAMLTPFYRQYALCSAL